MKNLFNKAPVVKDKISASLFMLTVLSLLSSVMLMLPVAVSVLSGFSQADRSVFYTILKGAFTLSLIVCIAVFVVNRKIMPLCIPSLIGAVMTAIPFIQSITSFINAKLRAEQFGMTVSYEPYIISIIEYLLFLLLCILTVLYILGYFRLPVVILVLSVAASILSAYTVINNYFILLVPIYNTLCFAPAVTTPLIPIFLITSTKSAKLINNKYQPKRMRQ